MYVVMSVVAEIRDMFMFIRHCLEKTVFCPLILLISTEGERALLDNSMVCN